MQDRNSAQARFEGDVAQNPSTQNNNDGACGFDWIVVSLIIVVV
jgi:hypothetical protein